MKKLTFKLLILALLSISLSDCKKEDSTGNLTITFQNHPGDLNIDIFILENTQIKLFSNLQPDSHGTLVKDLNPGNYYIVPSAVSLYPGTYRPIACQIQKNSNTIINYDSSNNPHIKSNK
jgi:hypothetical protein